MSSESQSDELSEYPDSDTFRILLVTDTHLGHLERDEYRRYDSFRAFDEALSIGRQYNVDFVLHAGDLFDKNQPSRFTMVKTIEILRKHCLGNKPIHFEIVSDQSRNFPCRGGVNYEDPNYNIALPIFIQHGNHDDPAGLGNHAALEQLAATNLVNYVGRVDDLEHIQIFPILMRKGATKLAVYPLGYIRDERLHRAFLHHKVQWIKPRTGGGAGAGDDDWFNIAMVHQNRTRHTQQYKDCIPEEFLPKFLDVVYWGHEHECRIDLTESATGNFFVTQPGSTVPTSLSQSETREKYVGIMEIKHDECRLVPKPLRTTRPFIFDELVLGDHFEEDVDLQQIDDFLHDKVELMVHQIIEERPAPSQDTELHLSFITNYTAINEEHGDLSRVPLVRLRVDYSGFPKLRCTQFGQSFHGKLANPDDILHLHKKASKALKSSGPGGENDDGDGLQDRMLRGGNLFGFSSARTGTEAIEDIVSKNIDSEVALSVFPELDLLKAVTEFVEKEDPHSIENHCDERMEEAVDKLIQSACFGDETQIREQIEKSTAHRRKVLRQQRDMTTVLAKEQEQEGNDDDNDQEKNEEKEKEKEKKKKQRAAPMPGDKHDAGDGDDANEDDADEVMFPKKKKATLQSFGFGNASQQIKENVRNSQFHSSSHANLAGEEEEEDDDLDLGGLDAFMVTVKPATQQQQSERGEPVRKRPRLARSCKNKKVEAHEDHDHVEDDDAGAVDNDVLDSLLNFGGGTEADGDGDGDVRMNAKVNTMASLSMRDEEEAVHPPEVVVLSDGDEDEEEDQKNKAQATQSRRKKTKSNKNSKNTWGGLLKKRGNRR